MQTHFPRCELGISARSGSTNPPTVHGEIPALICSYLKRDLFIFLSTDWLPFLHNNPTSTWAAGHFQKMLLFLIFPLAVTSKHLMVFNLQPAVRSWSSSPWLWWIPHSEKLKHFLQQNGLVSFVLLLSQTSSLTFPLQDYLSFFFFFFSLCVLTWL